MIEEVYAELERSFAAAQTLESAIGEDFRSGRDVDFIDYRILLSRLDAARSATAMLAALMRGGFEWAGNAPAWRDLLVAMANDEQRAQLTRELDELVLLAMSHERRPLRPRGRRAPDDGVDIPDTPFVAALDLRHVVRSILDDHAWIPLRRGDRSEQTLARVREAAEIVVALGDAALDVAPDDVFALAQLELPPPISELLLVAPSPCRPAFSDEGTVERVLRENGASYNVWTWAAPFHDDREAAWAAITSPDVAVEFARSYLGPEPIRRAFGAILEPLVAGPDYREVRFDPLRVVVAKLGREGIERATHRELGLLRAAGPDDLMAIVSFVHRLVISTKKARARELAVHVPDLLEQLRAKIEWP